MQIKTYKKHIFYSEKVDVTYESNPLGIFIYMSRHVMVRESLRDITAHIWRFTPIYTNFLPLVLDKRHRWTLYPQGFWLQIGQKVVKCDFASV